MITRNAAKQTQQSSQHSPEEALLEQSSGEIRADITDVVSPRMARIDPVTAAQANSAVNSGVGVHSGGSASRTDLWALAHSSPGLFGAVVPDSGQGTGQAATVELRSAEGLGFQGLGLPSLLRSHWTIYHPCFLLYRLADGSVRCAEVASTNGHLTLGQSHVWTPTLLFSHYWAPAELARNRNGSSASEAWCSMFRLGILRGYAEQLWLRIHAQGPSLERDGLISQYRIAQAINRQWTAAGVVSRSGWSLDSKRELAISVFAALFSEMLVTAGYYGVVWPMATGVAQEELLDLADMVAADDLVDEVVALCRQPVGQMQDFLQRWGVYDGVDLQQECDGGYAEADRSSGPASRPTLSHVDVEQEGGDSAPDAALGMEVQDSGVPSRAVGQLSGFPTPSTVLSAKECSDPPHRVPKTPPVPTRSQAPMKEESSSPLKLDVDASTIADMVAAAVAKQLGQTSIGGQVYLDYDDEDEQQAPEKVRQGLHLLQPIGDYIPRKPDAKIPVTTGVQRFAYNMGNPNDATGNIVKHLNQYDMQATRVNASYAERARDLDKGAFLDDTALEMHRAMQNSLTVYVKEKELIRRRGESLIEWEKRQYKRAIRLMLLTFHAHKPKYRLLSEMQAITLPSPTSTDFVTFANRIFQLYTQLSSDQRTRGQYFHLIFAGLLKCTITAHRHDGPYWAGRFNDRYNQQTETSRNELLRKHSNRLIADVSVDRQVPLVVDEQNTNIVIDIIRDEMEQNEHAQATWGTTTPAMVQRSVVDTPAKSPEPKPTKSSGCTVCGLRHHNTACKWVDAEGRLDLNKLASKAYTPHKILKSARQRGCLASLSEGAYQQRVQKLNSLLVQLGKANSASEMQVMQAAMAQLQEQYQQTADKLHNTQAELTSVRQAHLAVPSKNAMPKPQGPGQVSRVVTMDEYTAHSRQVRIMAPDPLNVDTNACHIRPVTCDNSVPDPKYAPRVREIAQERPTDVSGIEGMPLLALDPTSQPVHDLCEYFKLEARALGRGRVEIRRSNLYYAEFGLFASQALPCGSTELWNEGAIGRFAGTVEPRPQSGLLSADILSRTVAVWTHSKERNTASHKIMFVISGLGEHGRYVQDPLDATKDNCRLCAWAPTRDGDPTTVLVIPTKPIPLHQECYAAHGVEGWLSRFRNGDFDYLSPHQQEAFQ